MFYNNSTFKIIAFLALFFLTSYDAESRIVDTIEALQEKKIGDKQASIKIVEFASLTCGHCAKFHNEVFPKIKKEYIDSGKIVFTYRDFPLDKFALKASVIARCSGNDRFFSFLKVLYKIQKVWTSSQDTF